MTRVLAVLTLFAALALPAVAGAHGSMVDPMSRVQSCRVPYDNPENPRSAACKQAVAVGGPQPIYDWAQINIGDANGRHRLLIPDGRLCSAANSKYQGFDAARTDWYRTTMTPGARFTFRFEASAPHLGHFELYVTKNGYDPRQPLRWNDLEEFHEQTDPPLINGVYQMSAVPPADRRGHHVIYAIWQRSDSAEAFYSCSDVYFGDPPLPETDLEAPTVPSDLRVTATTSSSVSLRWSASTDNVGVAGYDILRDGILVKSTTDTLATVAGLTADTDYAFTVRARDDAGNRSASSTPVAAHTDLGPTPTPTATATPSPSPSPSPTASPSPTPTPMPTACDGFTTTSDWGTGYVGEIAVRNPGTTRIDDWRYSFDLPAGAVITGYWSARLTRTGTAVTFAPESWTRSIPPGGAQRFGFQVSGATKPSNCRQG